MISVLEAKKIVSQEIPKGSIVHSPLEEAFGRVLAEDLYSPIDSPLFSASAMDGFAIRHEETYRASRTYPAYFKTVGLVKAGDLPSKPLGAGEAMRIMTGAMIPEGATGVIPQEEVLQDSNGTILISREVSQWENIRPQGEEMQKGDLALEKGTSLTSGVVGFLASLGILEVPVYQAPKIFIVPTGSELVFDPSELAPGKVMESNSYALRMALREIGIEPKVSSPLPDLNKILFAVLEEEMRRNDILLITGGVSVGDLDLVKEILKKLDVKTLFWQVNQKPGKPLYFGRFQSTFIFGLPGNPVSSLVCFYEYVRPAILEWLGYSECFLLKERAKLTNPFKKQDGRVHFVRAKAIRNNEGLWVTPLTGQESHKMKSFALANCLMVAPQERVTLESGEEVTIHWLP